MTEFQILGLMLVLQGILTIVGLLVGFQTHRETRTVFRVANETLLHIHVMADVQERTAATLERLEKRLNSLR
jgi:hypothetical protein